MSEKTLQQKDVYFHTEYGKLYEKAENGICDTFVYSDENGTVCNTYIKREVPQDMDDAVYYDITSPYGYGGPCIVNSTDKNLLIENFRKAWNSYCIGNNIISEFVRFHPLEENHKDFGDMYNAVFNRHTLAIELTDDFFATQFSSKCRNSIRKAEKEGVSCVYDLNCENMDSFINLYYETMKKNNATTYYFFKEDYFYDMKKALGEDLILVNALYDGKIISSSLFMLSEEYMHYHLSATDPNHYNLSANNLILKYAADFGVESGRKWLHLGGGLSSDENDALFKFKRSFAREEKNLKDFCIGRLVHNEDIYNKLTQHRIDKGEIDPDTEFFPKYRA
ncbi:MAG: GNAT family N-acetyltransferase [Anaerofustis stercorihominis]|nr:GNAT family N-acetyltransferase [Anaerofustis stercorihominis]